MPQRSFDVQHHLLGFGLDAARNQIAILILAGLTGKEQQIADPCGFRVAIPLSAKGPSSYLAISAAWILGEPAKRKTDKAAHIDELRRIMTKLP